MCSHGRLEGAVNFGSARQALLGHATAAAVLVCVDDADGWMD